MPAFAFLHVLEHTEEKGKTVVVAYGRPHHYNEQSRTAVGSFLCNACVCVFWILNAGVVEIGGLRNLLSDTGE